MPAAVKVFAAATLAALAVPATALGAIVKSSSGVAKRAAVRPSHAQVPSEVLQALRGNDEAARSVTEQLVLLKSQLVAAEKAAAEAAEAQALKNKADLDARAAANKDIDDFNAQILKDIGALKVRQADLRETANELIARNKAINLDIKSFWANMSYVQEYLERAVKDSASEHEAPSLDVLKSNQSANKSSKSSKSANTSLTAAMVQVNAKPTASTGSAIPEGLDSLQSALDHASEQRLEKAAAAEEAFTKQVNQSEASRHALLDRQEHLIAARSAEYRLVSRLEAAVETLELMDKRLSKQRTALRSAAQALGSRPMVVTDAPDSPAQ